MPRTRRFFALVTAGLTLGSLLILGNASTTAAPSGLKEFEKSGISGSGAGAMQTMMLPARIDRVAVRRDGSGEAWALGTSSARLPGWNLNNESQGQAVFFRYLPSSGWQLVGPPTDQNGSLVNPVLSDIALSSDGEGWAVGAQGTLLYHEPGSTTWVTAPLEASETTTQMLQSISLTEDGGRTIAYASGQGSTLLRYVQGEGWKREPPAAAMTADLSPGLFVAAVSADVAWAVSDSLQSNGVKIYRRSPNGNWSKVLVGDPIFDAPPATGKRGGYNSKAWGSAIAADSSTVWVGGAMQPGEAPFAPQNELESDVTRPFVVQIDQASGSIRSTFCPNLYRLRQRGDSPIDTTALCDKPFPSASFDVPSISIVGGEAYAGGQGLFHFKSGSWFREPNSNSYLISISMASANEGWVATNGNTYLRGGAIRSNSPFIGHWTSPSAAIRPSVARWPQTQEHALESIAISPDHTTALAVGQSGSAIYFDRQLGWDKRLPNVSHALHGVAWPGTRPWVVGEKGFIGRFDPDTRTWTYDPSFGRFPTLFGIAFRSPSDGIAVGAGGTIIAYNGAGWRQMSSPTTQTLYAVIATQSGYLAVGREGTILENRGEAWFLRTDLKSALEESPYRSPSLYAVTVLPNGKIIVGGQRGALLAAEPGGQFVIMDPPLEGTVLALTSGTNDRVFASVSPDENKFNPGGAIQALRGTVMTLTSRNWQDISLNRRIRASNKHDSSSFDDPVLAIATVDGVTGWAVGGSPSGIPDINPPEGHLRAAPYDSGSVYRIDLSKDPNPGFSTAKVSLNPGINFAVFGESWCGLPPGSTSPSGLCSSAVGSGTQSDLVALRIRDEINRIAYPKDPNGPRFVLFTGSMRRTGIPEELAQFKSYLAGFHIPVYAALGTMDLFSGFSGGVPNLDPALASGSNDYWKEAFYDMALPWGDGTFQRTPSYIRPVGIRLPNSIDHANLARTHYAFDVLEGGVPALRVVVIDSSTKSYGNSVDQEPQFEAQDTWLSSVISNAKVPPGIPTVVLMNQPTIYPLSTQIPNWLNQADKSHFEIQVISGVTAVFAGGFRWNTTDSYPARRDVVPLYVMGGGGAALGYESPESPVGSGTGPLAPPSLLPSDGFYHGWHLVSLDPNPNSRNLLGQAPHTVKSFMALEYLGIHALDGEKVSAGHTLKFQGFARQMAGGWSDPQQAKSSTFRMGFPFLVGCDVFGPGGGYCQSYSAISPPYRFWSEDPSKAQFVYPNPVSGYTAPFIHPDTGAYVIDPTGAFGFLCTFNKGTVGINLESGMINRRMVITIGPGDGPCVKHPVLPDPEVIKPIPKFVVPEELVLEKPPPFVNPPTFPEPLALVLPPVPAPIAAPAPPASAATSRKEEEEHQTQAEGQEGDEDSKFMVLSHAREINSYNPILGWLWVGSAGLMGLILAFGAATASRKPRPEYVRWRIE